MLGVVRLARGGSDPEGSPAWEPGKAWGGAGEGVLWAAACQVNADVEGAVTAPGGI